MSKVFLSYSREDSLFVNELHRRLQRDGVDCFYDIESIAWGANWVRELEKGVDEADFVVMVLTPAFLASKWAELERTGAMATRPDRIRPLLRVPCEAPAFLRVTQAIDVTTDAKFEEQSIQPRAGAEGSGGLPEARELLSQAYGTLQAKLGNDHSWTKAARQGLESVEREE